MQFEDKLKLGPRKVALITMVITEPPYIYIETLRCYHKLQETQGFGSPIVAFSPQIYMYIYTAIKITQTQ